MESMAQTRSDSNRDELELALNDLKAYVERAARQGIAAHEVEAGIWQSGLATGPSSSGAVVSLGGTR